MRQRARLALSDTNEQIEFPPFPRDRQSSSGYSLPGLPAHHRVPARPGECRIDGALPPGASRSARRRGQPAGL